MRCSRFLGKAKRQQQAKRQTAYCHSVLAQGERSTSGIEPFSVPLYSDENAPECSGRAELQLLG
jgi:hypothetical protein